MRRTHQRVGCMLWREWVWTAGGRAGVCKRAGVHATGMQGGRGGVPASAVSRRPRGRKGALAVPLTPLARPPCPVLQLVAGGMRWVMVAAGFVHTCGVEEGSGDVYCWGNAGSDGRVGVPGGDIVIVPVLVNLPTTPGPSRAPSVDSSAPADSAPAPEGSSSGSSNTAAIVGGVVGGELAGPGQEGRRARRWTACNGRRRPLGHAHPPQLIVVGGLLPPPTLPPRRRRGGGAGCHHCLPGCQAQQRAPRLVNLWQQLQQGVCKRAGEWRGRGARCMSARTARAALDVRTPPLCVRSKCAPGRAKAAAASATSPPPAAAATRSWGWSSARIATAGASCWARGLSAR